MRGDMVIVRAFGDLPLVRRVWEENEAVVFITDDHNFNLLSCGKDALWPIGFPREDVFKFAEALAAKMKQLHDIGKWDWSKLIRF